MWPEVVANVQGKRWNFPLLKIAADVPLDLRTASFLYAGSAKKKMCKLDISS